jgi:dihydrofolate reductase
MRIVLSDIMSLDGVVQSPGGHGEDTQGGFAHGGWSMPYFEPETMGPAVTENMASTEALLFGRRTWQTMAAAWPGRAGDPFADRMNEIPEHVASRTLTQEASRGLARLCHRPTTRLARYPSCEHNVERRFK